MDLLMECAMVFERLLPYEYHFVLGRKGKIKEFVLNFDKSDFHHLAGLHKLKDNARLQYGKRSDILDDVLKNKIRTNVVERSVYYKNMQMRLKPLVHLEEFLDTNDMIFQYNEKVNKFSSIKADYILKNQYHSLPIYLFLGERNNSGLQMCRTFFPKESKDYTVGQPQ